MAEAMRQQPTKNEGSRDAQIAERWRAARRAGPLSKSQLKALYEHEAQLRGYEGTKNCTFSLDSIHEAILRMVRSYPCLTLLDIGCGPNPELDFTWLKEKRTVVGLEYCFGYSQHARLQAAERHQTFNVVNADAGQLPFLSNAFDNCVCTETLEHVLNPDQVLSEIYRVLKPGGYLFLTVPNEKNAHTLYRRMLRVIMPWKLPRDTFEELPHHLQHFSRRQLIRLFKKEFLIQELFSVGFSTQDFSQQPVEYLLGKLVQTPVFRNFSSSHAFVLRVRK